MSYNEAEENEAMEEWLAERRAELEEMVWEVIDSNKGEIR